MKTLAEQNKGLFTVQAMWEAMPLDMYCQVVGNSNRHPAILQLLDKGLTMGALLPSNAAFPVLQKNPPFAVLTRVLAGDLLPEEYQAIVDMHARRRLNFLMDVMCRMDLIRGLLISDNSHVSRIERSVYIVKPDVAFDEPKKVSVHNYVRPWFFPFSGKLATLCAA